MREVFDPREWAEATLAAARDTSRPWPERQAAWLSLYDRGYVKPPTSSEFTVRDGTEVDARPLGRERLAELEAELLGAAAADGSANPRSTEPPVIDEQTGSGHLSGDTSVPNPAKPGDAA